MRTVDKIRYILNILFLIGAGVTLVIYLASGTGPTFMYAGFTTLAIKIIEFILRFIN